MDYDTFNFMKQINDYITHFAQVNTDCPFLIHGDNIITYSQTHNLIQSLSEKLQSDGLKPGQTAGILIDNCPEYIIVYLAITNCGAIATLLPHTLSNQDIASLITTTRVSTLFYAGKYQESVNYLRDLSDKSIKYYVLDGDDKQSENLRNLLIIKNVSYLSNFNVEKNNALLLFSSGGFKHPQATVYTHESLIDTAKSCLERFPDSYSLRTYSSLPFFHFFALTLVINLAIISGGTIIIPGDDSLNSLFYSIEKYNVNLFLGNSTFIKEITSANDTQILNKIDFFISAGIDLPQDLKENVFKKYNAVIMETYGIAEAPVITLNLNSPFNEPFTVGKPLSCCQISIVDENGNEVSDGQSGRLLVRGANTYHHYFDQYQNNYRQFNDWLDTGDVFRRDSEDYLYFEGKQCDHFFRNGYQITSKIFNSAVLSYPGICEYTVLNCNSNERQRHDQIKLAIVTDRNSAFSIDDFRIYCENNLPKYLMPDEILLFDNFEINCLGIVKKSRLSFLENSRK